MFMLHSGIVAVFVVQAQHLPHLQSIGSANGPFGLNGWLPQG